MITVQLVKRVLDGLGNSTDDYHDVFDEDQSHVRSMTGDSLQFVRYDLVPPRQHGETGDNGEGEGEGDGKDRHDNSILQN